MGELHENPTKLYRGDNEFCDVIDFWEVGQKSEKPLAKFGSLKAKPITRKTWKMLCSKRPHLRGMNAHTLRKDDWTMRIEIEDAEATEFERSRVWEVEFTSDASGTIYEKPLA